MNIINTNVGSNSENLMSDHQETANASSEFNNEDEILKREFARDRVRGFVVHCDSEYALVSALSVKENSKKQTYWAVGQLVSIKVGVNRVVGMAVEVKAETAEWDLEADKTLLIKLELVGEIITGDTEGSDKFTSGISNYPQMGCIAHRIRSSDLATIYKSEGDSIVTIGHLTQDPSIDAKIDIDKLLSRHFAVVGTTGVGKSTSVTLLLRKIIKNRPDIRVLLLDPHNEFSSAFHDTSVVIDAEKLILPCWLFKLDELAEVIFKGQQDFDMEIEILGELIAIAKEKYQQELMEQSSGGSLLKQKRKNITADLPIPYRIVDLLKLIEERMGILDNKSEVPYMKTLITRIESIRQDPRFRFMFDASQGGDIMESITSQIFRIPQNGRPIAVLEMSGLPSEVVNAVVSVLCRMAFDLAMASEGGIQTLVVCEEAHRYIPEDKSAGFYPTQLAVGRIAKEGRKYGVSLGIITQRPGELDSTIVSQCNTFFAMRLGNCKDQEIIKNAVTNGAKSTIGFLSSIANRECIAFGEAVHTPIRLTFETMAPHELPGSHIYEKQEAVKNGLEISLHAVLKKIRLEDKTYQGDEGFLNLDQQMPQTLHRQPGDEINSIIDAAYDAEPNPSKMQPPINEMQMRSAVDNESIRNMQQTKDMQMQQQQQQQQVQQQMQQAAQKLNAPINSPVTSQPAPQNKMQQYQAQRQAQPQSQSQNTRTPTHQDRSKSSSNGNLLNNLRSKF